MAIRDGVVVSRVKTAGERADALAVLRATYREEKGWVPDEVRVRPESDLRDPAVAWFVTHADRELVGVLRVLYDPPIALYREYGFRPVGEGNCPNRRITLGLDSRVVPAAPAFWRVHVPVSDGVVGLRPPRAIAAPHARDGGPFRA